MKAGSILVIASRGRPNKALVDRQPADDNAPQRPAGDPEPGQRGAQPLRKLMREHADVLQLLFDRRLWAPGPRRDPIEQVADDLALARVESDVRDGFMFGQDRTGVCHCHTSVGPLGPMRMTARPASPQTTHSCVKPRSPIGGLRRQSGGSRTVRRFLSGRTVPSGRACRLRLSR